MRQRPRSRNCGRLVRRAGGDPATIILTVTNDGSGFAELTCAGPNRLTGSESLYVSGTSVAGYNGGPYTLVFAVSNIVILNTPYTADAVGGTWRLA